jgi:proteic killer suppression protein
MIKSFKDETTRLVFEGKRPKDIPSEIFSAARRKLGYLNAATVLKDMDSPPGNKLHPLDKDRKGQHAIWINSKYRICFEWTDAGVENVEIVDYH